MSDDNDPQGKEAYLLEVYKAMWSRVDKIDRSDLTFVTVPPAIAGLILAWFTFLPSDQHQSDDSSLSVTEVLVAFSYSGQILVAVIALILLRSYADHNRAISNIAAMEKALGIDKFIPKRVSTSNSVAWKKFIFRLLRSSKGILFIFYNGIIWAIAYVVGGCGLWLSASVLQAITITYVVYYAVVIPGEASDNRE